MALGVQKRTSRTGRVAARSAEALPGVEARSRGIVRLQSWCIARRVTCEDRSIMQHYRMGRW